MRGVLSGDTRACAFLESLDMPALAAVRLDRICAPPHPPTEPVFSLVLARLFSVVPADALRLQYVCAARGAAWRVQLAGGGRCFRVDTVRRAPDGAECGGCGDLRAFSACARQARYVVRAVQVNHAPAADAHDVWAAVPSQHVEHVEAACGSTRALLKKWRLHPHFMPRLRTLTCVAGCAETGAPAQDVWGQFAVVTEPRAGAGLVLPQTSFRTRVDVQEAERVLNECPRYWHNRRDDAHRSLLDLTW
jgi:hypothetical protein